MRDERGDYLYFYVQDSVEFYGHDGHWHSNPIVFNIRDFTESETECKNWWLSTNEEHVNATIVYEASTLEEIAQLEAEHVELFI